MQGILVCVESQYDFAFDHIERCLVRLALMW